jgi:hypothetical protein
MEKEQLIKRFLNLQGNHQLKELSELQNDLEVYLQRQDDIQLSNIHRTIQALLNCGETDNLDSTYAIIAPVLNHLSEKEEAWSLDEIRIIMFIANYMDNFEEAYLLTKESLMQLERFKEESLYSRIKTALYVNLTSRLLRAKYCDAHYAAQKKEIDEIFDEFIEKSLILCKENNRLDGFAYSLIRKGLFMEDQIALYAGQEMLRLLNNPNLCQLAEQDIKKYIR